MSVRSAFVVAIRLLAVVAALLGASVSAKAQAGTHTVSGMVEIGRAACPAAK